MTVGEIIKEKRIEAGLTQLELAKKLGIAQNTVAQYETGQRAPKIKQLISIAKALNFSAAAFLSNDGYDPIGEFAPEDYKLIAEDLEKLQVLEDRFIRARSLYSSQQSAFLKYNYDITSEDIQKMISKDLLGLSLEKKWKVYFYIQELKNAK